MPLVPLHGVPGVVSASGALGAPGASGIVGAPGASGALGAPGASGVAGASGASGVIGAPGSSKCGTTGCTSKGLMKYLMELNIWLKILMMLHSKGLAKIHRKHSQ